MSNHSRDRRPGSVTGHTVLALVAAVTLAAPLAAQSLQGSKASVEKMYDFAESHHYDFHGTDGAIDGAVARGRLVALTGDSTYTTTSAVGWSYARPETKQFIEAFAPRYMAACGAALTVTSAARPLNHQPHNANPHSVHPTGMAFDIRRPPRGPCLTWLRSALLELEEEGLIEATEEHHPVGAAAGDVALTPGDSTGVYRVRGGDTLCHRLGSRGSAI